MVRKKSDSTPQQQTPTEPQATTPAQSQSAAGSTPQAATASPMTKGQRAVALAAMPSDTSVLAGTFIGLLVLTSAYFLIEAAFNIEATSGYPMILRMALGLVGGIILFAVILAVGMIVVRMQRQMMLGNAMQVEYSDYAWLRDWANIVAADLELPRVEIFVTQDPVINAYAFGFIDPYCIVLNSGSIRYLSRDELKTVVVHEMAHIKYRHTLASVYLQPFITIPVVSIVTGWIAGFWQRRCEYTADRLALTYMWDAELVKNALVKVHIGPDTADGMNEIARQWMQYTAERPMNRFAQTFSNHPFLVRRLSHVDRTAQALGMAPPVADSQPAKTQDSSGAAS